LCRELQEHLHDKQHESLRQIAAWLRDREKHAEKTAEEVKALKNLQLQMLELLKSSQLDTEPQGETKIILSWLSGDDYSSKQGAAFGQCHEGTGKWLIEKSEKFTAWLKDDSQTMFCYGDPGAGKTVLTSLVIDTLKTKSLEDKSIAIAYIYCNFQQQETTAEYLLSNILKQLAAPQDPLPECIKSLHAKHSANSTRPLKQELLDTVRLIAGGYSRVFIMVDALDECPMADGSQARFISQLRELQAKSRANVFATSRPIPNIVSEFKEDCITLQVQARDEDVRTYLVDNVYLFPNFVKRDIVLQEEIITKIIKSSGGM
jgi:Cdc6-like AAA superfamily ATPase